jgi:polysaccharide biosynthesis protein PelF
MRVCLIVEGAYPYVRGGMSSWIQQLMLHMPDVEFIVQSIAATREDQREFKYKIPDNCTEIQEVYLMDDDYVNDKKQSRIRMNDQQYDAFEALMFGGNPDWETIIRFFGEQDVSLNAVLSGEDFLSMTLNYYEQHHNRVVFTDFLWTMRSMYLPLFTILKSRVADADIYHSASSGYAGIWASLQRVLTGKPFLMSEHGIYTREREEEIIKADWVKGIYKDLWINQFRKVGDCCYKYADRVTALYEGARQFQLDLGCPEEKTLVIPNGMDPARFANCPKKDSNDTYINLGALLRVAPIKDLKTMINAFALAKQVDPRLKLWIMGGLEEAPEYANECMNLVEALHVQDVVFTGLVNAADYIGKMDIMLLSSLSEGQPLTILEAFTAKKPFITTDVGNCRGLLEGEFDNYGAAGIVVPIMNETKLAKAILELAEDPALRQRMGEIGYRRVIEHYDEDECYMRFYDLYKEMLSKGRQ